MKEMRVKGEYIHHKEVKGAMGIKICANDLENSIAGSQLFILRSESDEVKYRKELKKDIDNVKKKIVLVNEGVCVAASTLGSLEALLEFLK